MPDSLKHIQQRLDALTVKFDDRKIGQVWVQLAKDNPTEFITTSKGLALTVKRDAAGFNKVAYRACLQGQTQRVAWMH